MALLLCPTAGAWNEDHHGLILFDALEYMSDSGNPMLEHIADWLLWARGTNVLLRPLSTRFDDPRCRVGDQEGEIPYQTAACALRMEEANTDWYDDMVLDVDSFQAFMKCLECTFIPPMPWDFDLWDFDLVETFIECHLACLAAAGLSYLDLVELVLEELTGWEDIPSLIPSGSSVGDYNLTSLNHFVGVAYEDDEVDRAHDCPHLDPQCDTRMEREQLGYKMKGGPYCWSDTEGDCRYENGNMFLLYVFGNLVDSWVSVNPDGAARQYLGVTCHDHGVHEGGLHNISAQRWLPVDNITEYGMRAWKTGPMPDVILLGRALHAAQDAIEPHHNHLNMGKGHPKFEGFAYTVASDSARCRLEGGTDCEYGGGYYLNTLFNPDDISEYFSWEALENTRLPENMAAETAKRAVSDISDLSLPVVWQAESECPEVPSLTEEGGDPCGYYPAAAAGHNLSVATTVAVLRRELGGWFEQWGAAGYCQELRQVDPAAWYRILPGPRAGDGLPCEESQYIRCTSPGSLHPYYNDDGAEASNATWFRFPEPVLGAVDTIVEHARLTFSPFCDWHDYEGDALVLTMEVDDPTLALCGQERCEVEAARFERAVDLGVVEVAPPDGTRLFGVRAELVQGGAGDLFIGGAGGLVLRRSGGTWVEMSNGTSLPVEGLWGSSREDVFAVTGDAGNALHYGGGEDQAWDLTSLFLTGFEDVWGTSTDDVWAVGNWWGYVYRWDGAAWTQVLMGGGDMTGLHGVWASGPDDVFAVGVWGRIVHWDGTSWTDMGFDTDYDLNDVHGTGPADVYAVGTNGTVLHYDGSSWTELPSGLSADLNAVWVEGSRVYLAGAGGLVVRYDGHAWASLPTFTTADLHGLWGTSGSNLWAVGDGGTLLHHDGSGWSAVETGYSDDLRAIWGFGARCSPQRRYGFSVAAVEIEYRQLDRAPVFADGRQIADALYDWFHDIPGAEGWRGIDWGVAIDCAPGSPCDQAVWGELRDAIEGVVDAGGVLEDEQVFDLAYDALLEHSSDEALSPALVAYGVARAALDARPGQSELEQGVLQAAADWSLWKQGLLRTPPARPGPGPLVVERLDFTQPTASLRSHWTASGLPPVRLPELDDYPGFREPTEAESASTERMMAYWTKQERDVEQYRLRHSLQLGLGNVSGLRAVLATEASGNPAAAVRAQEIDEVLATSEAWIAGALERLGDDDGDGVSNGHDYCRDECARGMDAEGDGCIDRACGLAKLVRREVTAWPAWLVLELRARQACLKAQRGQTRAALAQLAAFGRQLAQFAALGWVEPRATELLRDFAAHAAAALHDDYGALECP